MKCLVKHNLSDETYKYFIIYTTFSSVFCLEMFPFLSTKQLIHVGITVINIYYLYHNIIKTCRQTISARAKVWNLKNNVTKKEKLDSHSPLIVKTTRSSGSNRAVLSCRNSRQIVGGQRGSICTLSPIFHSLLAR